MIEPPKFQFVDSAAKALIVALIERVNARAGEKAAAAVRARIAELQTKLN